MAQQRSDAASTRPRFHIIVWNENGAFVDRLAVGAFMGTIQSKISYTLRSDVDGSDEAVVSVGALLITAEDRGRDGCTGSWNIENNDNGKGPKGKDRWWHTERSRWREVALGKYF